MRHHENADFGISGSTAKNILKCFSRQNELLQSKSVSFKYATTFHFPHICKLIKIQHVKRFLRCTSSSGDYTTSTKKGALRFVSVPWSWLHFSDNARVRKIPKKWEEVPENPELWTLCVAPSFLTWLLCLLSRHTQIRDWLGFCLSVPRNFNVHYPRSDVKLTCQAFLFLYFPKRNNLQQSINPLGLFSIPNTTKWQPTTATCAMVWAGVPNFLLHEQCVKTAPSWWRF